MAMLCRRLIAVVVLGGVLSVGRAQNDLLDIDALIDAGQQLLDSQVDPEVIRGLKGVFEARKDTIAPLMADIQRQLQGEYVVDVAALKELATALLPILEKNEELAPYAGWLRPRMDYFDALGELQVSIPPPESGPTNAVVTAKPPAGVAGSPPVVVKPPARLPNPPAATQREVWVKTTANRAMPPGAERYVGRVKPIFAAFGVPEELVWLAEVESSFDREAMSPVGAAGLFQLMPPTAKAQGLAVEPRDERLHVEKSARAAAIYLRRLYERFGDWRLALAAYNAGEGRVQRLLDQAKVRTFDDISGRLPAETQMYVPKVEAVIRRREGVALTSLKLQ